MTIMITIMIIITIMIMLVMIITVVIKAIIIVSIIKGKFFLRSNVSYIVIMAANYAKTSALIA